MLEDTQLKRETIDDKLSIVDVRLTTKSGKIVHIEMQILNQDDMPERVTYYNAKMIVTQLKSGNDYDMLVKTISIVISDFEIVKNSPKYHHTFQLNDRETGVNFTDIIEIDTLELNKIPEQSDNTTKYDWLRFLKAEKEEEFNMLSERSPTIKKAVVELKRLSQDEETQRIYEAREKAIRDENSRIKTAVRTAVSNAKREIIVNLSKIGLSDNQISEVTEVDIIEIKKQRKK